MKPDIKSKTVLGITRAKAKMFEYDVPPEQHIEIPISPTKLFSLTVGLLGSAAAKINNEASNVESLGQHGLKRFKNQGPIEDVVKEYEESLHNLPFAAFFFDAFRQTRLASDEDRILLILGASAYYLCDYPGSSSVLARLLTDQNFAKIGNEPTGALCNLLCWTLNPYGFENDFQSSDDAYQKLCYSISQTLREFYKTGKKGALLQELSNLRTIVYANGTPIDLLFADVACAIVRKRISYSAWENLPNYSVLPKEWEKTLSRSSFLRELWPSQRRLGENGVYSGDSAVIQMPTSAGKTRAIEIILRSSFLSGRSQLSIIVAPFRALCHEIHHDLTRQFVKDDITINEVSDVFEDDLEWTDDPNRHEVMIVTPEKLLYILRQHSELAGKVGLVIYDEGHQFDSGIRGVTYELLLTSLKNLIPETAQTILISAVLTNALDISTWLNGTIGKVVSGTDLNPTYRTTAFASWRDTFGRLEFPADPSAGSDKFFVSRLIREHELPPLPGKRKTIQFPTREGPSIGLYLALILAPKGNVAVFCGKKDTVAKICENVVELYERGLSINPPKAYCDNNELQRLVYQAEQNLGPDSTTSKCAKLGIFPHHGNVPHGLRISIEHALKKELIHVVICTSTLAQGINLPIRYLLVASIYQSKEPISVRDFHNLLGRAGRAGMHTEGSVIFTDPSIFDDNENHLENQRQGAAYQRPAIYRTSWRNNAPKKWAVVQNLLNPELSEKCGSSILSIFDPITKPFSGSRISIEIDTLVSAYLSANGAEMLLEQVPASTLAGFNKSEVLKAIDFKLDILKHIESYLISEWQEFTLENALVSAENLAKQTLAYHLADLEQQIRLVGIFSKLALHIYNSNLTARTRKAIGRSLLSIREMNFIQEWAEKNILTLLEAKSPEKMLNSVWPLLETLIKNETFLRCTDRQSLQVLAVGWISGVSYSEMYAVFSARDVRFGLGDSPRYVKQEHVIELCEQALAFDGMLIIGALRECIKLSEIKDEGVDKVLSKLQRRVRYGAQTAAECIIFELGFADRHLAKAIASCVGVSLAKTRNDMITNVKRSSQVRNVLQRWPTLFTEMFQQLKT